MKIPGAVHDQLHHQNQKLVKKAQTRPHRLAKIKSMKSIALLSSILILFTLSACEDGRQRPWSFPTGYGHHDGQPNSAPGLDLRPTPVEPERNPDLPYNK